VSQSKKAWPFLFVSLLIVIADQLVKYYFLTNYNIHTVVNVFPFLNFILRFNPGAAFSFLGSQQGWQIYLLSAISIIVSGVLIGWLCRLSRQEWWIALPVSFVLGGAIGNLIDRLRFGVVIDFIDFHIGNWHYATFNVADSFVCIGAFWIIVRLIYESIASES
jgi:signal peptidase II